MHEYGQLAGKITQIVHCAAAARFDLELSQARAENVGGVENILELAQRASHIERLDYVGTAYRLGECDRTVYENDISAGRFRNTYEQSKCEAEMRVLEHVSCLPIMIARPSIVICDSQTGKASVHNGFCRAVMAYMSGRLRDFPGLSNGLLDIVPVDYVAAAMIRLSTSAASIGKCFHLTAGLHNAYTLSDIQALSARHSGLPAFRIVEPPVAGSASTGQAEEELRLYASYLCCNTPFDNTECVRLTNLRAPNLCTYYARFINWIRDTILVPNEVNHV